MGQPAPHLPPWLKRVYAAPNGLYAHGLGWTLGRRFLQLTHWGRRSGREFHAVLEVVHYDRKTGDVVVISGYGRRADWLRNITTNGQAAVSFGRAPRSASYRILPIDEAVETNAAYERRNWIIGPGVKATLTLLLGWRYDGTPAARREMAEQLPMVAFRPV